tara:strand:- start:529 stop:696 length:168 start_codon:yes stop_codon:yes gene_type:complete
MLKEILSYLPATHLCLKSLIETSLFIVKNEPSNWHKQQKKGHLSVAFLVTLKTNI